MTKIGCSVEFGERGYTALRQRSGRKEKGAVWLISGVLLSTALSAAQTAAPAAPVAGVPDTPLQVQEKGYVVHQTADLGGHLAGVVGSGSMYDTLVNIKSGPRVLGQTFTLHAVEGSKHTLVDSLEASSNGFGGDPINYAHLSFYKGKAYEFGGTFRRDRQYFDYDLLGNPSIPSTSVIPYGMVAGVPTTASLGGRQVQQSAVLFNTVRRMTDASLTVMPLSEVSLRISYGQNIFQGPSLTPGYQIGTSDQLLSEYQRNSTDDFIAAVIWKPVPLSSLTFQEQVNHYKEDSYYTLAPSAYNVQEADGTPAALGNWDATTNAYTISSCNTASMGSGYTDSKNYTILTAPIAGQTVVARPVINPACNVTTSYSRYQPTRILYPTESLLFQSSSIRNVALNGDLRYTVSNSNLPHYSENFQGLDKAIRSYALSGYAGAQRRVVSVDYGMTWEVSKTITLSEQLDFSNVHQPGSANVSAGVTQNAPTTAGNETVNFGGPLLAGASFTIEGNPNGIPLYGYFGQQFLTNNVGVSWDASSTTTLGLIYRYRNHQIVQGAGSGAGSSLVKIDEEGGIFNAAFRPTRALRLNGSIEFLYDGNALTPLGPRQTRHYRFHTVYKLKPWATLSAALNDLERHNNTFNTGVTPVDGPLGHVDHSRMVALGVTADPNEHYGFDVNYSYSDVYISTNACYLSGASATLPGTASLNSSGAPNICPGVFQRGSTTVFSDWGPVKDFADAPTQYASVGLHYSPNPRVRTAAGYRISAVSGNQFFADAQQVNGSLQSAYQSPFLNAAFTIHPGWVWKAEYNYYGYGEGGASGAPLCSTSTSVSAVVVPCNSPTLTGPTGLTESPSGLSSPRNFHGNILTLAMHYEF